MNKLDKTDIKLLAVLEEDARQSLSKIAKRLNTSQQVISYRLGSLQKRGIISSFYTMMNITKFGYTNYRTMIRLSNLNDVKHKEIISYLKKHSNVLWLVECGGRWDLIVNFMAKHIIQYSQILKDFKNKFPEQIQNYDVLITLEVTYFGRDYFNKTTREIKKSAFLGREFKIERVDKIDIKILNEISENARISIVSLAKKTGLHPNTAISRIKSLTKKGIIQGYKPLIHLEQTPYHAYKALIKFQNITEKKEREVINYLNPNVKVVGFIKMVGEWDFEIEFEEKSKEEMLRLTRSFRDRFKEVVNEFEVIPLFHEYRYNFFPKDLIERK